MGENTFWDDLGRMLAEIDYMMHKAVGKVRQKAGMYRYPHAHIKEKENEIIIEVELPGMRKEDIEITKMDIESIKHMLKKRVDFDEFATLEKRVSILERRR